jgi:hypothetical protein
MEAALAQQKEQEAEIKRIGREETRESNKKKQRNHVQWQ